MPTMSLQKPVSVFLACLLAPLSSGASAADDQQSIVRFPNEIVYQGEAGRPQHVTIFGDPPKREVYVDRIRFPAGTRVMPHWHPDEVRTVLVLSGTFYFAVGDEWDEARLKPYPAGTLYSEPARTPHFAFARDGEVILQVTGIGPTGNTPVPPR